MAASRLLLLVEVALQLKWIRLPAVVLGQSLLEQLLWMWW
jgi:hypothetical protein